MIIFDLACPHGHRFEGWFRSSEDFDRQYERGLTSCPQCGSLAIKRVPSAPHLAKQTAASTPSHTPAAAWQRPSVDPRSGALAAYRQLTEILLANCEDVGARFAEEARRIHYLEAEERSIRGEATREEYEALRDEGIEVLRLPRLKPGDLH
ncbi:DUF1178 family protein [Accumulibacter sp.]|uniref:DUF1178 family protein n=1 Tax=Accumulibacter sp. TaxID=2053492 RepID=UPI00260791E0|nr:DUF1178 family protein [Accumulibacter sp.]